MLRRKDSLLATWRPQREISYYQQTLMNKKGDEVYASSPFLLKPGH